MKKLDEDNNINIGSIFKGLDKFINIVADMVENEKSELNVKGSINDPERGKKIVGKYGVNIKIGGEKIGNLGDINTLSRIKNNLDREKTLVENLEPMTDIFEEDNKIIVVMELPGVVEEDIEIDLEEDNLKIRAEGSGNCYSKNIKLAFIPKMELVKPKLNNSIYSIIISKDS
jgi:HSP20 family protein